ncbi:MAG: S41 family peptidase, partial [Anaerolineae bacterium]|nr:S41 family peptidase [Anaerolineae bacterium]
GPLATVQAMANQVTLKPPTPIGGVDLGDIGPNDYVKIVQQAWHIINANYVRDNFNGTDWDAVYEKYIPLAEQVTSSEELWDLLTLLVGELNDNHSRFVPPSRMEAEFGVVTSDSADPKPWSGVYVWPAREDQQMMIWCVSRSGPGDQAGLRRGDVILAVDGQPIERGAEGYSRAQRSQVFYGSGGSSVTLTVQQGPDAEPKDVTLQLALVSGCDGWSYDLVSVDPRIGYIRVPDFDGDADFNIMTAIRELEADGALDGLIVDIRHNPGGNSDASAAIFAEGLVGTVGSLRADATRTVYRIRGPVKWNAETPLVVLTDGNSHSAADYFPAAMRVLGRATMIGMPSAGNTEGITGFNLADGTLIRLAVSILVLEDGSTIEGVGVVPDVEVSLGDWGLRQTPFDVQMQAAIDYLLNLIGM